MGALNDLTGQIIGNWHILYRNGSTQNKAAIWRCKCLKCGKEYDVVGSSIISGGSTQCLSCAAKESHTKPFSKDPIKNTFLAMKERCNNPNTAVAKYYYDKDIKICDEWINDPEKFYTWAYENGFEKGLTIERDDVDKGYYPENCKFIPAKDQQKNKSNTLWVTIDNEKMCLQEACDKYNLPRTTVKSRSDRRGISLEQAINELLEKRDKEKESDKS